MKPYKWKEEAEEGFGLRKDTSIKEDVLLLRDSDGSQFGVDAAVTVCVHGRAVWCHHSQMAGQPTQDRARQQWDFFKYICIYNIFFYSLFISKIKMTFLGNNGSELYSPTVGIFNRCTVNFTYYFIFYFSNAFCYITKRLL